MVKSSETSSPDDSEVNYFDSEDIKLDLAIKRNKLYLKKSKLFASAIGCLLAFVAIIWAGCQLNSSIKHYGDIIAEYAKTGETLVLWMYGLSICSLMALLITLCLSLIRLYGNKKPKIKPETVLTALINEIERKRNS